MERILLLLPLLPFLLLLLLLFTTAAAPIDLNPDSLMILSQDEQM